jgi:hypothetical protein
LKSAVNIAGKRHSVIPENFLFGAQRRKKIDPESRLISVRQKIKGIPGSRLRRAPE